MTIRSGLRRAALAAVVLTGTQAAAQSPVAAHRPAPTHARKAAPPTTEGFQMAPWASLQDDATRSALAWVGRTSSIARPGDTGSRITVYSRHRDTRDDVWRDELSAAQPSYEASNSAAAGSAYTSYPQWSSPQEERLMSTVKEAIGACGYILTCPQP